MTTRPEGPLSALGPAARWSILAGIVPNSSEPPSGQEFVEESDLICQEGLAPVVVRALAAQPTRLTSSWGHRFRSIAFSAEMRSMAADVTGASVLAKLKNYGIAHALIKGPSIARLHPPGWPRPYADIDVLVSPSDYLGAVASAKRLGFSQSDRAIPQWSWFDQLCREGTNLHSPSGGNVDFHHHIPPWAIASHFPVKEIIARARPQAFYGTEVSFGSTEDLLVISAFHILNDLWKGKLGLSSWRDVILLTRTLGEDDARASFERAGVAWMFDLLSDELASALPECGISPSEPLPPMPLAPRLRMIGLGWSNDSSASRHRLAWATRLPLVNAMAFLAGSAVPSRKYIRSRHGSYMGYWKRGLAETASTMHGSDYRMTTVDDYGENFAAD